LADECKFIVDSLESSNATSPASRRFFDGLSVGFLKRISFEEKYGKKDSSNKYDEID
jgi:hypothetical protein